MHHTSASMHKVIDLQDLQYRHENTSLKQRGDQQSHVNPHCACQLVSVLCKMHLWSSLTQRCAAGLLAAIPPIAACAGALAGELCFQVRHLRC